MPSFCGDMLKFLKSYKSMLGQHSSIVSKYACSYFTKYFQLLLIKEVILREFQPKLLQYMCRRSKLN